MRKDFKYKDYLLDIIEDAINNKPSDIIALQIWHLYDTDNIGTTITLVTKDQFQGLLEYIKSYFDDDANAMIGDLGINSAVAIESSSNVGIVDILDALIMNGKTNFEKGEKKHGKRW